MVGTLIAVGNGRINQRDVYEMLTIPSKYSWNYKIQPAPSNGLYLINVEYPDEIFANNPVLGSTNENESDLKDVNDLTNESDSDEENDLKNI